MGKGLPSMIYLYTAALFVLRALNGIVACLAAVILLAAIYVGSYLPLSEPTSVWVGHDAGAVYSIRQQSLRYGGSRVELFLWPLTQIDIMAGPDYWSPQQHDPFSDSAPDPFAPKSN